MGATIERDGSIWVLRLTGMLRKSELDAVQWNSVGELTSDRNTRVLVIAESFEGWQRGDPWGDLGFTATYGAKIKKMACVAEPRWEDQMLMFTGAGLRRTQIRFFALPQLSEAYAWLAK